MTRARPLPAATPPTTDGDRGRRPLLRTAPARLGGLGFVLLAVALAAVASVAIGVASIGPGEVLRAFTGAAGAEQQVVVLELRLPRTLVALAVGIALGACGAVMQGLTRNPLADPGILGVQSGAAFAVVLAIYLFGVGSATGYAWFALGGATVAAAIVYTLGGSGRASSSPVTLALAGAALTALLTAMTSAVIVLDAQTLDQFRFWVVGSVAGRDLEVLYGALPFLVVGLVLVLGAGRGLNALALGQDMAAALGRRTGLDRLAAAVGVVTLAGGAVAMAGPIGFVGLTVPHVARALIGADYRWLIPWSALLGALLLLVADVVGRLVAHPAEVQVGIVMALVGAPVFVALVRRQRLASL